MQNLLTSHSNASFFQKRTGDVRDGSYLKKADCSLSKKQVFVTSFRKTLLTLGFLASFFQLTFDQHPFGGVASLDGPNIRTSALLGETIVDQVTSLDSFLRVNQSQDESGTPLGSDYDAEGNLTTRAMAHGGVQNLTWDSLGRLIKVTQNEGSTWSTTYDGFNRRIQTVSTDATGKTAEPRHYYYDPEVTFLELGQGCGKRTVKGWFSNTTLPNHTWQLYGPDRSGTYGGAQGIGGLESTFSEKTGTAIGALNNLFGDTLGTLSEKKFTAYNNLLGGYGALPGSTVNTNLQPEWRGHYLDETGFYYFGNRYYDPESGRFLSADPLGHTASLNLYDYCGGDPVNGLDPDGRCVEATLSSVPGQGAWQQAIKSFNDGNYGWAALNVGVMLGEQAMTVASFGVSSVATTGIEFASSITTESSTAIEETIFTNWNEFQAGTRGQFSSRTEASRAWSAYKNENQIVNNVTRNAAAKSKFLKEMSKSQKAPRWMNQWLQKGKVPPGYHVDHIKPLSIGGEDAPANMRLLDIEMHKMHHNYYQPWN